METVLPLTLIEDFSFYPRHQVNDTHVTDLIRALASGATLPPIIVDRASKRIADGYHRRRAWMKFYGEEKPIPVEWRDYPDEAAFYLDAVRLNASHGRKLDRQDQTRIVLKLQELKVDSAVIASALHVPEPELRTLAIRVVYDDAGLSFPHKRGLEHLRGQHLSPPQLQAMRSVRSAEAGRLCMELILLLENNLVDYEDPKIQAKLSDLSKALTLALKKVQSVKKKTITA